MSGRRRVCGFSIVELLVALALSAILLGGVIAMFLGSRTSYAAADRLAQVHENGRYGLDEIVRDVRSAGFLGCAREQPIVTSSLPADQSTWDFLDAPIRGFQQVSSVESLPALGLPLTVDLIAGSDVLLLRGPKRNVESARLVRAMRDGADGLNVARAAAGFAIGDVVLAHNCDARSYFTISSIEDGVIGHAAGAPDAHGNTTASLGYAYAPPAELTAVETAVYYVARSRSADTFASLWRRQGASAPQELAAGVEQMQLQFGVDASGDGAPDQFVNADAVSDWRAVRSVSIALLVHSAPIEAHDRTPESFQLLDVAVAPADDGRVRKSFIVSATPRNPSAAPAQ